MTISEARNKVKNWSKKQKERVRKDVEFLTKFPRATKISANTSFILEKCFRKDHSEIMPADLLKFL